MNILNKVSSLYWRYLKDCVSYAKHIGVSVGNNTEIYTKFWSSEPFLITIGNNVQITDNVHFYTLGGVMLFVNNTQILMPLVRSW